MGYILPIQQHEYHEYQKRISKVRHNPYEIEKPFKVILESQYEDVKQKVSKTPEGFQPIDKGQLDRIYAELTGSGYYINEQI